MQGLPNRMGLGMRPQMYGGGGMGMGQGPSISALAAQQQMGHQQFAPPSQHGQPPNQQRNLFVGSISGGITDEFLNQLLLACGPIKPFKRMITPANKPQGFGFVEFEEPDGMIRAMQLLNGVDLPAMEEGCASKKLLVKADEKTKLFLDAYASQKMRTDVDEAQTLAAKAKIAELVKGLQSGGQGSGGDRERYVIPPHLHDLQENDLPEEQRGLVVSEIALFRERAAKREREKIKEDRERTLSAFGQNFGTGHGNGPPMNAPSGPKDRFGNRPPPSGPGRQHQQQQHPQQYQQQGFGGTAQSYSKPPDFVKSDEARRHEAGEAEGKTDLELENDRKEARKKEEEMSFRDRERRYEPRERQRIFALEKAMARERAIKEAEERDRHEMRHRLDIWDDEESDEMYYVDRERWRMVRRRKLDTEEAADAQSRAYEDQQAENLRQESEQFLARQMLEMQSLQEEQRKAGMLLDDSAPIKLNVSIGMGVTAAAAQAQVAAGVHSKGILGLGQEEEEEEETAKKKKLTLTKLEYSLSETGAEKIKQRLEKIKETVPKDREPLFKAKVRWDGMNDILIDRKLEPIVRRKLTESLGELDDDELPMFVLEHLKDHKGPAKLVEGLEPVLADEAEDVVISLWRQIIFESMAYEDGINTGSMLVDS